MNLKNNSQKFNNLVRELASGLLKRKLSEITSTASIDGYETPNAFGKVSKKRKKVSDILRDIWIKRTSWGGR